jgi:hypothetical protein
MGLTTNSIRYNKLFFLNYHFFGKSFQTELKLNMYNLNPKIYTRSCIYTSFDNEARKKNYSNEKQ